METQMAPTELQLKEEVRAYWESNPCGVTPRATREAEPGTREWFEQIEHARYEREPFIPRVVQFERGRNKKLLEVGVGAGVDHLQWARAGADCHGVDLTDAGIDLTRRRLAFHGLTSNLQRVDAE